jgi:hypothetical protein
VAMPMCAPMPAATPRAAARELLGQHRVVEVVAPASAELGRVLEAEQPELGHAGEHVVGKPARVLPLPRVRAKLLGHEAPNLGAQAIVLLGEGGKRPAGGRLGEPALTQRAHGRFSRIPDARASP